MDIEIFDTTLRDGSQDPDINFTLEEKLKYMILAHDILPSMIIEMSYALSDNNPFEYYQAAFTINNGIQDFISTFGSTHHPKLHSSECRNMKAMVSTGADIATIFGKTWISQLKTLGISRGLYVFDDEASLLYGEEEALYLKIIENSVRYLKENGFNRVIYDAEHFFSGLNDNKAYALETLRSAIKGGADTVVLCDTKGGLIPSALRNNLMNMETFFEEYRNIRFGIHCHNDSGCAVANTLDFVDYMKNRKIQVQGTVNGYGERCGNADIITVLCNLIDKFNLELDIKKERLTELAHEASHIATVHLNKKTPYVGSHAFSHKAGMHIHQVKRISSSNKDLVCSDNQASLGYCHTSPEKFGNHERFLMTSQSGKEAYSDMAKRFGYDFDKNGIEVSAIYDTLCFLEKQGYRIADLSSEHLLIIHDLFGDEKIDIQINDWNTQSWLNTISTEELRRSQTVVTGILIGSKESYIESVSRTQKGPVDSQYKSLKKAIADKFDCVNDMRLIDFEVELVKHSGTESPVRVSITYRNGDHIWKNQGVSENILEASMEAIVKGFRYNILRNEIPRYKRI